MLFYKFRKPGDLEFTMLRRGELFFASPAELNDAHECRPRWVLEGNQEHWRRLADWILWGSWHKYGDLTINGSGSLQDIQETADEIGNRLWLNAENREVGLEELGKMFDDCSRDSVIRVIGEPAWEFFKDAYSQFIKMVIPVALTESRHIASFSLDATNPTMWGHYAAAEKGFVLVYSSENDRITIKSSVSDLFECSDKLNALPDMYYDWSEDFDQAQIQLHKVHYNAQPPTANAFVDLIPRFLFSDDEKRNYAPDLLRSQADKMEESRNGLVKSEDWQYEKEIRAFFPTSCDLSQDDRVLSVDISYFAGVIFGSRMSESDKVRVCVCCKHWIALSKYKGYICIFQAEQDPKRFDFAIKPVRVIDSRSALPLNGLDMTDEQKDRIESLAKAIEAKPKEFGPFEENTFTFPLIT